MSCQNINGGYNPAISILTRDLPRARTINALEQELAIRENNVSLLRESRDASQALLNAHIEQRNALIESRDAGREYVAALRKSITAKEAVVSTLKETVDEIKGFIARLDKLKEDVDRYYASKKKEPEAAQEIQPQSQPLVTQKEERDLRIQYLEDLENRVTQKMKDLKTQHTERRSFEDQIRNLHELSKDSITSKYLESLSRESATRLEARRLLDNTFSILYSRFDDKFRYNMAILDNLSNFDMRA